MNRIAGNNVPVLAFHKIDPRFEWGITRSTPQQFRAILSYLKDEGFETISIGDLSSRTIPEKPLILTFDDAYESVFDYAFPLLELYGFTATLFVITGFIGSMNTWDLNPGGLVFKHLSLGQILRLRDHGWEIGSHTVNHQDLTTLPDTALKQELECSKSQLEGFLREGVDTVAFPFGRYDEHVLAMSQKAGYKRCCGVFLNTRKSRIAGDYVIGRKPVYLIDTVWNVKQKVKRTFFAPFESTKLRIINFCSRGTSWIKPSIYRDTDTGS